MTSRQFGDSWHSAPFIEDYHEKQFYDWISPVNKKDFKDKVVLEAGCGKGRHTVTIINAGAREVYAVDFSDAVFLASSATKNFENVLIVQGDINNLPFSNELFDNIICVGVLHHLSDPEKGLKSLWSKLKKGGILSLWVYAYEGNWWIRWLICPIRKNITSKLPVKILKILSFFPSLLLFIKLRTIYKPTREGKIFTFLPYSSYLYYICNFPLKEIHHIVVDHLCPPIAFYLKKSEIECWFKGLDPASLSIRFHNGNSWAITTKK